MNNKIIIGLGGFGVNFVHHVEKMKNYDFDLVIVSEKAVVDISSIKNKIYMDNEFVKNIIKIIKDKDKIFIINGLGGESCQYLNMIVDELLKQKVNVNIICTKPFKWEGDKREKIASNILHELELIDINVKIYENDDMRNYISEDEDVNVGFKIQFDMVYKNILKSTK